MGKLCSSVLLQSPNMLVFAVCVCLYVCLSVCMSVCVSVCAAREQDLVDFFADVPFAVPPQVPDVYIQYNKEGRLSGEVYVRFASREVCACRVCV